ncbi:peptidase inhibitor family I36 protein [Nonomuraea cavernae]|uniref:peptidase inhibitor family I36 protein n=1 Tax=Nonomuraea cavernae TaxID=2045107 RepID=UPI0033D581D0
MKPIIRAAAVVGAALSLTLVLPAVAFAGPRGTCSSGRVCLYKAPDFNNGFSDLWADFGGDDTDLRDNRWRFGDHAIAFWSRVDNETSSLRNDSLCRVTLWQNRFFTGAHSTFEPGAADGYLPNNAVGDNSASSLDISCG